MNSKISCKFASILLISILAAGCALFRPSLQSQLLHYDMVFVEGGDFMMGDFYEKENEDALPLHRIILDNFYIGAFEVTYKQYDAFAKATGREKSRDDGRGRGNRAVVYVSWYDAVDFCSAYGYRLPAEPEWEYAARAGGKDHLFSGTSEKDSLTYYARYARNSAPYTFEVGSKQPNDLGLFDMTGNVSEYVGDYYSFYRSDPDSIEYYPLDERAMRIIRGGSFNRDGQVLRNYYRVGVLAGSGDYTIGFRCAKSAE